MTKIRVLVVERAEGARRRDQRDHRHVDAPCIHEFKVAAGDRRLVQRRQADRRPAALAVPVIGPDLGEEVMVDIDPEVG